MKIENKLEGTQYSAYLRHATVKSASGRCLHVSEVQQVNTVLTIVPVQPRTCIVVPF